MIKVVTYHSIVPGPRLLVLGAIHGNEKCGTEAIDRMLGEIESGKYKIARGQATFIPICNPRAYAEDKRYIERNLNRYLVPVENPQTYEAKIGNILCTYFTGCEALLDIHSYTIGGDPFISYRGESPEERAFAASIGVHTLLTGWEEVYAIMGRGLPVSKEESTGGPQYVRRHGGIAVTLECGQHKDPHASEVAYQGVLNALRHFGMLGGEETVPPQAPPRCNVYMTHVFYRDEGGTFPQSWKNFEPVKSGTVLATYPGGREIAAPNDGFIVMPKPGCPVGEEWFYFGVERPSPDENLR